MPRTGTSSRASRARTRGTRFSSVQAEGRRRRCAGASMSPASARAIGPPRRGHASVWGLGTGSVSSSLTVSAPLSALTSAVDASSKSANDAASSGRRGERWVPGFPGRVLAAAWRAGAHIRPRPHDEHKCHAPGDVDQDVVRHGVGHHHHDPAVQQRQALHRSNAATAWVPRWLTKADADSKT